MSGAKTAEPIWKQSHLGPRNPLLERAPDLLSEKGTYKGERHGKYRGYAKTVGGNAAFGKITLTTRYSLVITTYLL